MTTPAPQGAPQGPTPQADHISRIADAWNQARPEAQSLREDMQRRGLDSQSIQHVLRELSLLSAIPEDAADEAREAAADLLDTAGFQASPERLHAFANPSPAAQQAIDAMPDPDWVKLGVPNSDSLRWITDALRQEWVLSKRALAAILDTIGAVQPQPAERRQLIAVMLDECAAAISLARAAALATRTPHLWESAIPTQSRIEEWADQINQAADDPPLQPADHARDTANTLLMDAWADGQDGDPTAATRAAFWHEVRSNLPHTPRTR